MYLVRYISSSNRKWLLLVNDNVTAMNNDIMLCGLFGLCPNYVAGILNSVEDIRFYVLCSGKLNYADYIDKRIAGKACIFRLLSVLYSTLITEQYFQVIFSDDTIKIWFETRQFLIQPSDLIFVESIL